MENFFGHFSESEILVSKDHYNKVLLIAKKIFEKAYFYHKNHFDSLDKVLSFLVYSLSSGKGFESNNLNYKLNENNKSNSLNDHFLYHNGNIPNSFKVNKNFKRYIDFLHHVNHFFISIIIPQAISIYSRLSITLSF